MKFWTLFFIILFSPLVSASKLVKPAPSSCLGVLNPQEPSTSKPDAFLAKPILTSASVQNISQAELKAISQAHSIYLQTSRKETNSDQELQTEKFDHFRTLTREAYEASVEYNSLGSILDSNDQTADAEKYFLIGRWAARLSVKTKIPLITIMYALGFEGGYQKVIYFLSSSFIKFSESHPDWSTIESRESRLSWLPALFQLDPMFEHTPEQKKIQRFVISGNRDAHVSIGQADKLYNIIMSWIYESPIQNFFIDWSNATDGQPIPWSYVGSEFLDIFYYGIDNFNELRPEDQWLFQNSQVGWINSFWFKENIPTQRQLKVFEILFAKHGQPTRIGMLIRAGGLQANYSNLSYYRSDGIPRIPPVKIEPENSLKLPTDSSISLFDALKNIGSFSSPKQLEVVKVLGRSLVLRIEGRLYNLKVQKPEEDNEGIYRDYEVISTLQSSETQEPWPKEVLPVVTKNAQFIDLNKSEIPSVWLKMIQKSLIEEGGANKESFTQWSPNFAVLFEVEDSRYFEYYQNEKNNSGELKSMDLINMLDVLTIS